jgi:transposase
MARKQTIITDEIYQNARESIKDTPKKSHVYERLNAIISAKEHGISHVSKILRITSQTLRSWVHKFAEGGVANLENKAGAGRKSTLKEEHLKQIEKWIKEDSQLTLAAIQIKLQEEYVFSPNIIWFGSCLKEFGFCPNSFKRIS